MKPAAQQQKKNPKSISATPQANKSFSQRSERSLDVANVVAPIKSVPIPIDYNVVSTNYVYSGKKSLKYIPFIGSENNLPNLLFESRSVSVTHDSCIKTIVNGAIGGGLQLRDGNIEEDVPDDFKEFLSSCNNEDDSFNELLIEVADRLKEQGNAFIEVVRVEVGSTKQLKVYVLNNLYCRLNEPDENTGRPTKLIYSKSFANGKGCIPQLRQEREIPLWDKNNKLASWKKFEDNSQRTVIHIKNKVSGIDHYGLPDSFSSLKHQVNESKSAQYNLDMFENNMVLSAMLIFKSSMTREEAKNNSLNIVRSHTGDGKQGRVAVVSSEAGIDDFDLKTFDTRKDGSFEKLDETSEQKIITAHGWAKEFATSSNYGGMNKGGSYLKELWDLKEKTTLEPFRKKIFDKVVKPILNIYKEYINAKMGKEVNDFRLKGVIPVSVISKIDPALYTKRNEAREYAGMPIDDTAKGEEYLKDSTDPKISTTKEDVHSQ